MARSRRPARGNGNRRGQSPAPPAAPPSPYGVPDDVQGLPAHREPGPGPGPGREPPGRRRRAGRARLTPRQVVAGSLLAGGSLAGAGYLSARDGGRTELDPGLSGGRTASTGQPLEGLRPDGAAAWAPSAAALRVPGDLQVEHLLNRITYGPTDELRAEVRRTGAAAWLAGQFAPGRLADPGGDAVGALFPHLGLTTADARRAVPDGTALQRELAAAHLGRAVWSNRQLLEVMVDLWSNHFTIACPSTKAAHTRHRFDADVIRPGALGSFEAMLQAAAVHPAMLAHFDADTSSADHPNENYARELLEAHTVGTAAGFTEQDVRQTALLFTGFQARDGVSWYVPGRHHVGRIQVLGFTHPNDSASGGRTAVREFLSYLARHRATADALARKLAVRFVSDSPPDALVQRLAQTYLRNATAIAPVLSALFTSAEFAGSAGAKQRRPMERLAAVARTLGLAPGHDQRGLLDLAAMLDAAGHAPLGSPLTGGYPDVASAWRSPAVALAGFNSTAQLVHGWWPRTLVNPGPAKLLRTQPGTRAAAVEAVAYRVLGRPPTASERAAAEKLLADTLLPSRLTRGSWEQRETIGLISTLLLCSPTAVSR
ncbi:MAG TPA: DUF1800 domain-containing protein [Kineosporiaceae bacterium]